MGLAPMGLGTYAYSASKAAVHHLTKILATELAGQRITVNAIAPGPFPSNMTAFATGKEETRAKIDAANPLGRVGRAVKRSVRRQETGWHRIHITTLNASRRP